MAFPRRLVALLLLFFLVVSSTGVPTSRRLMSSTVRDEVSVRSNFQIQFQDVKKGMGSYGKLSRMERRMSIELADYPETGANNNHDPKPPGRV